MKPSAVLRLAAAIDFVIAGALIATPFLRSRVGMPIALLVAAAIASGSALLLVIAQRLDR
jgi:hypothetical protein